MIKIINPRTHKGLITLFLLVLLISLEATAQNEVAIGSPNTKSNAILYLNGNGSQGLILPVVTNKTSVSGPDKGMIVFDDSDKKVWYRNDNAWVEVGGSSTGAGDNGTLTLQLFEGNTLQLRDGATTLSSVKIAGGTAAPGAFMVWNGTTWQYATLNGDVTGANGALQVGGIKGKTVPALPTTTTTQALVWDGTAWKFQALTAGTDSQDLSLNTTTNSLSLTNDATPVSLTPYMQTLSLNGNILGISGGTSTVTLPSSGSGTVTSISAGTGLTTSSSPITDTGTIGIAPGGVDSNELKDGSVTSGKIASNAVSNGNIASNANIDISKLNGGGTSNNNKVLKVVGGVVTYADDLTGSGDMTKSIYDPDNSGVVDLATTVTTNANLTGPVTSTGNATSIANGAITNAMLATINTAGKVDGGAITSGNIVTSGTITATSFTGNGAGLTNVPLTGTAGGDLTGTYPNPVIGAGKITNTQINTNAAIDDTKLATISTPGKVSGAAITSGNIVTSGTITATSFTGDGAGLTNVPLTGTAGGDLTGTYPNPTVGVGKITNAQISTTADIADTKLATITTLGKVSGNAINTGTIGGNTVINTTGAVTAASFTGNGAGLTNVPVTGNAGGDLTGTYPNPTIGTAAGANVVTAINNATTSKINFANLTIPTSTSTTTGLLTGADWTTFNSKGSGTLTAVSVTTANGFSGTSSGGATPALTLTTSVGGILKGQGGAIVAANSGTDYLAPNAPISVGTSTKITYDANGLVTSGTTLSASDLPAMTSTLGGAVPTPPNDATKFLAGDGTWATPAGGGTGTVTSVSVTTANGISGVVTDPTGAPAISLSLGAITPTTVNGVALSGSSTLAVTGPASVSGTNTGDQTITLTGNVTGTGTGSFPTTIANGVVTNAMLNAVPTATFKGRATAASGAPEDLTVAQAKTLLNLTGTNTGDQTITLTGDVTGTGTGSFATTLATVPVAKGGTGLTAAPANGQLMIGNGTGYALSTLTAGTGVNITNAAGTITINTSGLSPALNSGQIYVGSVGNLATGVDMSGDATISNSGVVTLSNLPATRTNLGLGALATLSTVNLAGADVTGILPVANGGTGRATWDGLLFGSGSTLSDISTGTAGQILKVAGTTPSWQDFIVTSTEITDGSITSDDILDGTITTAKIAPNGTTRSILANGTAGNVQWVAPSGNNQVLGSNGTGDLVFRDATTAVANSGTGIRTVAGGAADGVIATELSVREALDAVKGWGLTGNDISATPTSFIGTTGSNDLIFKTNSAETMRITPTGNVGIGTNAPLSDLQISNTTHLFDFTTGSALSYNLYENAGNLLHTTAGSASALALEPAKAGLYVNSAASANASFGTSLANRMVLTETGLSVNKDAADPSAVLHVVSETLAGGGTPRGFMMPSLITSDRDAIPSPLTGLMIFNETTNSPNYYNGTSWQSLSSGWGLTGNTLAGTERIGSDNAQPLVFETSNTERMRIDATGNVGIGTTSPLNLFHINNDAATGNFMRITNSGAPSGMLIGNSGSGGKEAFVSNAENAAMYFQTNSANRMAIDATGNVGIGTITPTAKLEVAGQIKMTGGGTLVDGYVLTSDATGLATWKAIPAGGGTGWGISGNAGLSDANFIGPSTVVPFNIKIGGSRSGRIDPTLANSFFGYEAGDVTTGANNSVFGYRALLVNTTGIDNTAIGYNALRNNSTAGGNTAVGRGALFTQSTDIGVANTWNTAVGFQALYFNQPTNTTTGKWNTAMGYRAGEANTSGSYNTFIGSLAGQASSAGINYSTAIGYNAQVTASNAIVLGGTGGDAVNVGIGVTAPVNKLDVEGGAAIGATYSGASVAPTNGLIVQGNVGIGIAAPNAPLQLGTATANRKLVLYDVNNNDHQFYGFGVQSGEIRYQTQSTLSNHRFYAGTSATTSGLLMTISGGGNVAITGSLSKGSGTFKIDHPLDPENKYLYHSFVESPDMMNVYNGNIITNDQGEVAVALPEYFEALNRDFRYQLTVIGTFAQAIVYKKIENNKFVIKTDKPNVEVSWQVTGIRKDPFAEKNPVIPEVEKDPSDKGRYLHPEAYGKPPEMKIGNVKNDLN